MENKINDEVEYLIRVRWHSSKLQDQYVGYRINKGICLTDSRSAYHLPLKEANEMIEELKKNKSYQSSLCDLEAIPFEEIKRTRT